MLLLITAIEHTTQTRSPLYILFVDLQKAYDTIDRGLLWLLDELGLDPALVGSLQHLYRDLEVLLADHPDLGPIPVR